MNFVINIKENIKCVIEKLFSIVPESVKGLDIVLHSEKEKTFGDLSCNAALVLAKQLKINPVQCAQKIISALCEEKNLKGYIEKCEIAGPGFINITLTREAWENIIKELLTKKEKCFCFDQKDKKLNYLIEFVSANPTGPLHFGHGRNGIIGDVLARVLSFMGHSVTREFYINDAGSQVILLGESLKARCAQVLGKEGLESVIPEGGYQGDYLISIAQECVKKFGPDILKKDPEFLSIYAKDKMLEVIKEDLDAYRISFDNWFSEKKLRDSGQVEKVLNILKEKNLVYEQEGALWFKSKDFGDDKDRVVKKSNGELTYIASDIAYHKDKYDRGYDRLIDILGQDHHGYIKRLKATMEALGNDSNKLDVILYQLVTIKENEVVQRMSKRAGTFTKLRDVIDTVGADVTRFFYLNRKAEAFLEFDLALAQKTTDENPVYYIQYAYVRMNSILARAKDMGIGNSPNNYESYKTLINTDEIALLRTVMMFSDILFTIQNSYQMHLLSYYTFELAQAFHNYYTNNRVLDESNRQVTEFRLALIRAVHMTLGICLDLLGLSRPEKM
jgi:arginyl-tRNA synthetase